MWKYIFFTEMQPAFYFIKYNHIYSHSRKSNSEISGNLICLQKDSEHLKKYVSTGPFKSERKQSK